MVKIYRPEIEITTEPTVSKAVANHWSKGPNAAEIKASQRTGEKGSFYGHHHAEETKKLQSQKKEGYVPYALSHWLSIAETKTGSGFIPDFIGYQQTQQQFGTLQMH